MAYVEPKWSSRLRAFRAENNAQFGGGPTPEEILAQSARPATPGRIQGVGAAQRYSSLRAARGGDPAALQRSIEARQAAQKAAEDAAAQEVYNEAERRRNGAAATATTGASTGMDKYIKKGYSPQYARTYAANDLSQQKQAVWRAGQDEKRRKLAVNQIVSGFEPVKDEANQAKIGEGGSMLSYDRWKALRRPL